MPLKAPADAGAFSLLTYNVAGLPDAISPSHPATNMPLIGPLFELLRRGAGPRKFDLPRGAFWLDVATLIVRSKRWVLRCLGMVLAMLKNLLPFGKCTVSAGLILTAMSWTRATASPKKDGPLVRWL